MRGHAKRCDGTRVDTGHSLVTYAVSSLSLGVQRVDFSKCHDVVLRDRYVGISKDSWNSHVYGRIALLATSGIGIGGSHVDDRRLEA